MGFVYVAALILGLGIIGMQLFMGSDSDAHADAEFGGDAEFDVDGDLDVDGHLDAHADIGHGGGKDFDAGVGNLALFLSLRFWTFGLAAFGITGSLLHYLELADSVWTPTMAVVMGLGFGLLASWSFRALARGSTSSGAEAQDALGQVGRVLIPLDPKSRGKVRIEIRGQTIDYLATTDDAELEADALVMVEEVADGRVHVSRAPPEFLASYEPRKR